MMKKKVIKQTDSYFPNTYVRSLSAQRLLRWIAKLDFKHLTKDFASGKAGRWASAHSKITWLLILMQHDAPESLTKERC